MHTYIHTYIPTRMDFGPELEIARNGNWVTVDQQLRGEFPILKLVGAN